LAFLVGVFCQFGGFGKHAMRLPHLWRGKPRSYGLVLGFELVLLLSVICGFAVLCKAFLLVGLVMWQVYCIACPNPSFKRDWLTPAP
jgi:hypothetical protein